MAIEVRRTGRRAAALSKEAIIAAAIEILDMDGEDGLTFRALAARLATGSGALYWHVADKNELLMEAADQIVTRAMPEVAVGADPRRAIHAIALDLFDAVVAHPWVGTRLTREPWRPGTLQMFERIGRCILMLGVPEPAQFDAWSALVNYILGVAGQNVTNAANARLRPKDADRSAFLGLVAARWEQLDPAEHPFVRRLARRLREHDDREQFLAGIDLILAGIETIR